MRFIDDYILLFVNIVIIIFSLLYLII